ncbi:MAG: hypothetical protein PHQ59_05545 [Candidatus Daviesbacteria bacterium]|nr:hypothetical protein [Candidatus Daviesbacteria bacterium]
MSEIPLGNNFEETKLRLLAAVQQDRWRPIVNPPYNFNEVDPRKAGAISKVTNILSRLAVATHVVYEKCYDGNLGPLLKQDKGRGRFQYLVQTDNPNFYHLVFLQGSTENRSDRNVFCQSANFIQIPETSAKRAKDFFVERPGATRLHIRDNTDYTWYSHLPKFLINPGSILAANRDYQNEFISEATAATTLTFNQSNEIGYIGCYSRNKKGLFVREYEFNCQSGDIKLLDFSNSKPQLWNNQSTWELNSEYSLNQDGILRSPQGQPYHESLEESLISVVAQLPLTNYIKENNS